MEKQHYEEQFKKAFMRGVCALNLEAMNLFKKESSPPKDKKIQLRAPELNQVYLEPNFVQRTSSIQDLPPTNLSKITLNPLTTTIEQHSDIGDHTTLPRKTVPVPSLHPFFPQQPR